MIEIKTLNEILFDFFLLLFSEYAEAEVQREGENEVCKVLHDDEEKTMCYFRAIMQSSQW